jgi:large subunit ribosomal protein L3
VPVTYLKVDDNKIVRTKTKEKDGYEAVVLGVGATANKTHKGKENVVYKSQKEFKVDSLDGIEVGSTVSTDVMEENALVTVVSVSKGKGFQGVIKRHHFAGGPASHGSHFKREPGSVGMRTWPGRIHPGKRMAGRMGGDRVTLQHRPVVLVNKEERIIAVKGPIPGPNGAFVTLIVEPSSSKK